MQRRGNYRVDGNLRFLFYRISAFWLLSAFGFRVSDFILVSEVHGFFL